MKRVKTTRSGRWSAVTSPVPLRPYEFPKDFVFGAAIDDKVVGAWIHDTVRMKYIHDHLNALESAIARGVDVRGYFAWSALDNLEWASGFKMTFGLVHVDRQTLKRTMKDSAYWYRDMIKVNRGALRPEPTNQNRKFNTENRKD